MYSTCLLSSESIITCSFLKSSSKLWHNYYVLSHCNWVSQGWLQNISWPTIFSWLFHIFSKIQIVIDGWRTAKHWMLLRLEVSFTHMQNKFVLEISRSLHLNSDKAKTVIQVTSFCKEKKVIKKVELSRSSFIFLAGVKRSNSDRN